MKRKSRYWYVVTPLERERLRQGLSYRKLADKTRLTPNTVLNVLKAGRGREGSVRRIAAFLGIPMEELLPKELAKAS